MLMRAVDSYLGIRRAAGFELRGTERWLRSFAQFATERGESYVRYATVIAWAAQGPSMYQRYRRLKAISLFARHACADDPLHEVPPDHIFGAPLPRRLPHIFGPEELRLILVEAGRLGPADSLRPYTYQTLFGLLGSCGLRISEALALRIDDVTTNGLVIRKAKFRKNRLVPMYASTEMAVRKYLSQRRHVAGEVDHLFVSLHGRPLGYTGAFLTFQAILRTLGLRAKGAQRGPRLHDLRHTLAVRALEDCTRSEAAGQALAPSTYLGYARLANTYWYLHATPRLMTGIADECRAFVHGETP